MDFVGPRWRPFLGVFYHLLEAGEEELLGVGERGAELHPTLRHLHFSRDGLTRFDFSSLIFLENSPKKEKKLGKQRSLLVNSIKFFWHS